MPHLGRNNRYDEPTRLKEFFHTVNAKEWSDETILENLNKIYIALNKLIQSDVEYYDARRKKQRGLSTFTRGGAFIFGTAGILAPLLQSANPALFNNFAAYGYPLLAIAGAFLVWNRLFGATGGHIRYVIAQFDLGLLITGFRLDWSEWLAHNTRLPPEKDQINKAFKLFHNFSDQAYQIVQEETKVWGKTISDVLEEYANSIGVKNISEEKTAYQAKSNNPANEKRRPGEKSND